MSIRVDAATVQLSEQTLREMLSAVEEAKARIAFISDPMPDSDLSDGDRIRARADRGIITVASHYVDVTYEISLENEPRTQESAGYTLKYPLNRHERLAVIKQFEDGEISASECLRLHDFNPNQEIRNDFA